MAKKLSKEQIHARLDAYEEAITHLELTIEDYEYPQGPDKEDVEQTKFVIKQLKKIAEAFLKRTLHNEKIHSLPHRMGL